MLTHPSHPAPWEIRRHRFATFVRAHEFAERQIVSLFEIDGVARATIRTLHRIGVDTADKMLATPTEEIVEKLIPYQLPPGNVERKCKRVELWKKQIRQLKESRDKKPMNEG